jgi:tetratricopeptide (TPR) repeat protein
MGTLRGFPNPPAMRSRGLSPRSLTRFVMRTLRGFANPPAIRSRGLSPRSLTRFVMRILTGLVAGVVAIGGCATVAPPVTKIVNGRVVETRAVSPEAYEHVARAHLYEEEDRWQDAAAELQRALPFDPEAAEVRAELAELFIRLGRLDDADDEIGRSLETAHTVDGYLARAHLAEARRSSPSRAGEPIASLAEACKLALADEDAEEIEATHIELADAQEAALDLPAAIETLRSLVRAAPETQRGRVQLAALAWPLGELDEASDALATALEAEPADVEARIVMAELEIATGHFDDGKASFRDAIDRADAPLDVADAFAGWLVLRGDLAEARELADRLGADAPDVQSLALAATLERTVKRPDRALAMADAARKLGAPPGQVALMVAAAQAIEPDVDAAVKTYLGIGNGDPSFFESRLRAAELLRDRGDVGAAARALDEASAVVAGDDSREVDLAIARSELEEKRGDAAMAARWLDQSLARKPAAGQRDQRLTDRLVLAAAAVDERRGDWKRALAAVESLLVAEPRNVEALNFAGFVAADHGGDVAVALKRLQAAMALSPGSGGVVDSVGWAYFRAGDLAHADTYLEQASRLEPADPEILEHLGRLYERRQERDRALAAYRKALALSPGDRVARELGEAIRTLEAKSAAGR